MSLVMHFGALAAAGLPHRPPPQVESAVVEIAIDTEPAPVPPAKEEPVPNTPPEPAPVKAAVHHEALAVHAVAATESKPTETPPADAPPAMVSDDALPHFTIATSTSANSGQSLAKKSGTATTFEGPTNEDAPYAEGAVDVPARAARKVTPRYPSQAQSNGLEGSVKLEIVLSSTGVVESVRALSHVGHGFEEEAIAAARKTPFTPAMKHGRAVAVRMAWTVEFQLQ
jgi:TonB family protein